MTNDKNIVSPTGQDKPHDKPQYENGKGCLMLIILTAIGIAIAVAAILIIGKPEH